MTNVTSVSTTEHILPPYCEFMFSEIQDVCAIQREDFGDSL